MSNTMMFYFAFTIALMVAFTIYNANKKKRQEQTMLTGVRVPGQLVAIWRQRHGQSRQTVRSRVIYVDPDTGRNELIEYIFDQYSGMPSSIHALGRGDSKFILDGRREKMLRNYEKSLLEQGVPSDQAHAMAMQRAHDHDSRVPAANGPIDDDGFIILPTPVNVDVYLDKTSGKKASTAVAFIPGSPDF